MNFLKILLEKNQKKNTDDELKEKYFNKDSRQKTFFISIIPSNVDLDIDIEFIELLLNKLFDRYKIGLTKFSQYKYIFIIGYTKIRKRIITLEKKIERSIASLIKTEVISECLVSQYKIFMTRINEPFDKAVPDGEFILGDGSEIGYFGKDVVLLDKDDKRYSWQNTILNQIYDLNKDEFREPNDRTIIWIYDAKGCTGKSKFVKWMCVNRAEEVAKIIFGTAGQLRSALISAGIRKCYFLDIPRTIGNDDSLESIISAVEDLKNGHLVSNFYGKYSQLIMNPPHVVIFSNKKCPRKMMSDDRWAAYEIKNNKLEKIN